MRLSLALALVSMLVSAPVFAADDDDGKDKDKKGDKKKGDKDEKGPSMDSGTDPVYSEKSEDGPFAPKSKKVVVNKETGKPEPVGKVRPRAKMGAYLEPVIGFGEGVLPGSDEGIAPEGTIFTFEAGGHYDLDEKLTFGLRLAWSTASVDVPGGEGYSAAAFAAPELMGEYRLKLSTYTSLPISFGLGIPVAEGNPDPSDLDQNAKRKFAVNALADSSHGLRDPELYQPKRLPVILGVGIRHQKNALELHAGTKFVFGINVGGDIADPDFIDGLTLKANAVAIRNVTGAGVAYEFLEKPAMSAGLDAWFSYSPIDPISFESDIDATPPSSFQFVVEPKLAARFDKITAAAGFIFPVAGQLGDAGMKGVRLHAGYSF